MVLLIFFARSLLDCLLAHASLPSPRFTHPRRVPRPEHSKLARPNCWRHCCKAGPVGQAYPLPSHADSIRPMRPRTPGFCCYLVVMRAAQEALAREVLEMTVGVEGKRRSQGRTRCRRQTREGLPPSYHRVRWVWWFAFSGLPHGGDHRDGILCRRSRSGGSERLG